MRAVAAKFNKEMAMEGKPVKTRTWTKPKLTLDGWAVLAALLAALLVRSGILKYVPW
jgi:hypothetical protein